MRPRREQMSRLRAFVPYAAVAALLAGCGGSSASSVDPTADAGAKPATTPPTSWTPVGSLNAGRARHTATLLDTGAVLVAGGALGGGRMLASAEVFDPEAGGWTVAGKLRTARAMHTATLLAGGQVLLAGGGAANSQGFPSGEGATASAELFDPAANAFVATGEMKQKRGFHAAARLDDGTVLVAGGASDGHDRASPYGIADALASAELYDPATGSWSDTGSMNVRRILHVAVKLASGKVLVVGGADEQAKTTSSVEVYDPATRLWTLVASLPGPGRVYTFAAALPSGKVLLAGGIDVSSGRWLADAWLYDPTADRWSEAGSIGKGRSGLMGAVLPSGDVLVGGGGWCTGTSCLNTDDVRVFVAAKGAFDPGPAMVAKHSLGTMTTLRGGEVLVAGGYDEYGSAMSQAGVSAH